MTDPSRALVFAGGGARGAYEAGVLCAVLDRMARRKLGSTYIDYVCGTSVGAIHAGVTAAGLDDPAALSKRVEDSWTSLDITDILRPGAAFLSRMPSVIFGGSKGAGLLDPGPLANHLAKLLPIGGISRALREGKVRAVTVTATHVPTGRPVLFVQRTDGVRLPTSVGRRVMVREDAITRHHVLASAAIPLLFPPVEIGGDLYVDGGLRLNTPLGPAVRLGATRVLVVGPTRESGESNGFDLGGNRFPSAMFLAGKVLNAFLLDHVAGDLDELDRINRTLERGTEVAGPDFAPKLRELARKRGEPPYHPVKATVVHPSIGPGQIASQHVRNIRGRSLQSLATRLLLRLLDTGEGASSDLASYLLFDGAYARDLLELGRKDAMEQADELDEFLFDPN